MTKDFRNVGSLPSPTQEAATTASARQAALAANQRIVLIVINIAAVGFLLAGLWLLSGRPSPIKPEIASYLGIAFVVAALADIVAAQVLQRVWSKRAKG